MANSSDPYRAERTQVIEVKRLTTGRWRGFPRYLAVLFALLVFVAAVAAITYQRVNADHVYPGVTTKGGVTLGSLTKEDASSTLAPQIDAFTQRQIQLRFKDKEWGFSAEELGARSNFAAVWNSAYSIGRQGNVLQQLIEEIDTLRFGRVVDVPAILINEDKGAAFVARLAAEIDRPVVNSRLETTTDLHVNITASQVGYKLDTAKAAQAVVQALGDPTTATVDLPVIETPPVVAESDLAPVKATVDRMVSGPLTLKFLTKTWTLSRQEIADLLIFDSSPKARPVKMPEIDDAGVTKFVQRLRDEIDQDMTKPRLEFNAGEVKVLREGRPGYALNTDAAAAAIRTRIATDNRTIELPVKVTEPPGSSVDRKAIKELVGTSTTSYAGSIPERAHNIELAATKLNGVVVGPDEIFSFNEELGPMTLQAGFQWGWGISQAQGHVITVPSVAGGICQVSTTLFQSIFWAGYQIEERNWHLYWITRYGQPPTGMKGLDATVDQTYDDKGNLIYALDFKFKNTTPYPILIETKADGSNLTFSLYSTKPTWEVKVDPPKIEDVVKADTAVVRSVDPSLAPGREIWTEAAEDGFKSTIVRTVTESGKEPRVLKLVSTYLPARNELVTGPPARP